MKGDIKSAIIGAIGGLVVAIFAPIVQHCLDHKPHIDTIDFSPQITHIGDNSRLDYPDIPDGRRKECSFFRTFSETPDSALLLLDAYDVDQIGAEVYFN